MKTSKLLIFIFILPAAFSCRKPYEPAVIKVDYNYLVVEGVINAGANAVTTIVLSRTKNLTDTNTAKAETGANVVIEGQNGTSFILTSQGNGSYNSQPLNLSSTTNYRLNIRTTDGGVYQSDFVPVKPSPPIDSLSWKQDTSSKDVIIYAHTHDPKNNTRYYRWDFVETWQYRAALEASWGVNNGLSYFIDPYDQVLQQYNCWGTIQSTAVSIASSEALSQDVISYAVVNKVPQHAEKMMIRYSANVRQYALTKEAYQYWELIQKSTQQTGTIFDPQPSKIMGNIHCISNREEPVIGFVSVSALTEKRIFIDHSALKDWFYKPSGVVCVMVVTDPNPIDFRIIDYPDTTLSLYFYGGGAPVLTKKDCLDCRRRGGTNAKPIFWN